MNSLEIAGVGFGIVAVWLTIRENPWCWPVGLVNVLLFTAVFAQARLYGSAGLQVVYAALAIYGWYAWLHGGANDGALHVSRAPRRVLAGLLLVSTAVALLLGVGLRVAGAALPMVDGAATSFSLAAQALQTRKWIENWLIWVVVDAVYVVMYASQTLYLTAGLYAVFLVMAVIGWRAWTGSMTIARAA
ncbi:MAG: nicotinamide riboside transporter PnuC [Acidobacteriota bacterium]